MKERFKPVVGFEGIYEVSSNGAVYSLNYRGKSIRYKRALQVNRQGYQYLMLSNKGDYQMWRVHRIVGMAFIPNPNNYPCINHKNGVKHDNRVTNLEWCNHSQNVSHSYHVLNRERPSTLSVEQYDKDGKFIARYTSQMEAQRITGINDSCISKVVHGDYAMAGGFIWRRPEATK